MTFKNVDPKLIRTVEDGLEQVYESLHTGKSLTSSESNILELEEQELVRVLENLYEDRHPRFRGGTGYYGTDLGKYIAPHEDE